MFRRKKRQKERAAANVPARIVARLKAEPPRFSPSASTARAAAISDAATSSPFSSGPVEAASALPRTGIVGVGSVTIDACCLRWYPIGGRRCHETQHPLRKTHRRSQGIIHARRRFRVWHVLFMFSHQMTVRMRPCWISLGVHLMYRYIRT